MGSLYRDASHRDGYILKPYPLTEPKAQAARTLLRGLYCRLGTWKKVADACGFASEEMAYGFATGKPIKPVHGQAITTAFKANKQLPKVFLCPTAVI